ncbi:Triosephosphate isomerase [Candidatus Annandia adelgestsuga]|uniref:Triosephosphate isomerase n=1 Tax=Candidatus Annandia adelgestsuga TaxID=1302411 RepID=A0A3S5HNY6_9ENTR|nr:triose-phosphate isomerase [Candidatus Annandia adelgestsuga]AZP36420.1 Triosephosphate isomerase [Candidatus Annandia adelgestsuga]
MKKILIVGNWKLNGNKKFLINFINNFKKKKKNIYKNCNIVITPPSLYLDAFNYLTLNENINLGAQNVDVNVFGSFTGDLSVKMLKDVGVKYVILGHSERRINYYENNFTVLKKFILLKKYNLIPIICIGENYDEKKKKLTNKICINQIKIIIKKLGIKSLNNTVIAYEPIWAIGTGKSAKPEYVQNVHSKIRSYISKYDKLISKNIIIQYGGSVNEKNAKSFILQHDIDGLLIGNSSLKLNSFIKIIKEVSNLKN